MISLLNHLQIIQSIAIAIKVQLLLLFPTDDGYLGR